MKYTITITSADLKKTNEASFMTKKEAFVYIKFMEAEMEAKGFFNWTKISYISKYLGLYGYADFEYKRGSELIAIVNVKREL